VTESRKVVAIVGMAGSGKTEVARIFEKNGFIRIRFGDITDLEIMRRGLDLNEENERHIRELLRREHGMAAYARLNRPRIDAARQKSDVVVDGLYSWEEYLLLKGHYGLDFAVAAVWSSPETRYARLNLRPERPLTYDEAASRDRNEIESTGKGGPIAMADHTIINESSLAELQKQANDIIARLK
jgi:dephospho-CoA kinase